MRNACLILSLALAGCSGGPLDTAREYRAALEQRPGISFGNPEQGRRATEVFTALYADLSENNVRARVRETYAPQAWFNDTIATEVGIDAIEKYLLKTARGAEMIKATPNDVAVSGPDCYVRWTMEVRAKNLAGGKPIVTEGIRSFASTNRAALSCTKTSGIPPREFTDTSRSSDPLSVSSTG